MPITALPQNTVRAIGSTSVITDPCSIVKELLDNALDASASSVFVEISQNTLDVIQVKDNGHGIPSEDRAVVCGRTFTSKIQTVEDLRKIGGSSLGFRGEALASVAEMSGGVAVTTRVAAEVVGSAIKYGRNGELVSSQCASHPVGTTVRITDFLKHIPVRKRTALKSAGKTLSKIKKLLQTYAVCQPTKRLSLKVMKAKNESNNWMYSGSQSANLTDAALKVVGTDVVLNCTAREWPHNDDSADYKIVALLAKDDADLTKVNNAGQYFGVDGRPLASGRGITRDITKLYRNYLRSSRGDEDAVYDPFLCLQIQCPPGSYDVNIEPAKDDVLFEDPQRILSLIDDLFREMYGDIAGSAEKKQSSNKGKGRASYNDGFELLMAQKSPVLSASQVPATGDDSESLFITPSSAFRRPSLPSISRSIEASTQTVDKNSQNGIRRGSGDREALNPWSMTKLNAPFRTPMRTQAGPSAVPLITNTTRRESVQRHRGENQMSPTSSESSALPSPPASNSNPNSTSTSPMDARSSPDRRNLQPSLTASVQSSIRRARERDRERYGNGAVDTWFSRITQPGLRESEDHRPENEEEEAPSLTQLVQSRFGSPDQSPSNTPETFEDLFTQDDNVYTQATPAPSQPLTQDKGSLRGPNQAAEIADKRQEFPVMEKWSARLHQLSGPPSDPELEQALDFERRKKEAIIQRREEIRNRLERPPSTNSPHHSRYLAARASLNSRPNEQQSQLPFTLEYSVSKSTLSPFDPRAYLIRQNAVPQEPPKDGKTRRIQTSKLPFEKIPDGHDLHDVCLIMPVDVSELTSSIKEHLTHDLYTQYGDDFDAFTESESEGPYPVDVWKYRLSDLVNKNYETKESGVPRLDLNFSNIRHLSESD
ncbi:hypothetical protein SI65_02286 [Aspergillus cristatus]|uniref:DNA mismatch repair protein S5 domain-containing protein n=1 Tax=Aspergillus cristatus TaxID=573508 RepID=A0A1E3BKD0_ASPCR|nr:hypothetical protein SI65_02286 [Aspergillus cristatus]